MGLAQIVGFESNKWPYRKRWSFRLHLHKLPLLLMNHWKRRGGNALLHWEGTLNKPAVLCYLLIEKQKNSERIPYLGKKIYIASQTQRGCIKHQRTSFLKNSSQKWRSLLWESWRFGFACFAAALGSALSPLIQQRQNQGKFGAWGVVLSWGLNLYLSVVFPLLN